MSSSPTIADSIILGRQAIFDPQVQLYAYELLYRDNQENRAIIVDEDAATARTMLNAILEIGLDQVVGSHRAFLNLTRRFILENFCQELPKERVVLEILETIEPDPQIVQVLSQLSGQGYLIALDDFWYQEPLRPILEIANIVKVDVLAHDREAISRQVDMLRPHGVKLLAEKVETFEDFELCKQLGFEYFQGFFFCKPKLIHGQCIPPNQAAILSLLANLQDPDIGMSELEELIRHDLSLSFKVLRYVNSAFFSLPKKIDSIRQAANMVGLHRLKTWATLIALASVQDKTFELLITAMIRARMCENLAEGINHPDPERFFTVGLFSVLEALFDTPMTDLLGELGLSPEVKDALLSHQGIMGTALERVIAYDRGDWEHIRFSSLTPAEIRNSYLEAIVWMGNILPLLSGE